MSKEFFIKSTGNVIRYGESEVEIDLTSRLIYIEDTLDISQLDDYISILQKAKEIAEANGINTKE